MDELEDVELVLSFRRGRDLGMSGGLEILGFMGPTVEVVEVNIPLDALLLLLLLPLLLLLTLLLPLPLILLLMLLLLLLSEVFLPNLFLMFLLSSKRLT